MILLSPSTISFFLALQDRQKLFDEEEYYGQQQQDEEPDYFPFGRAADDEVPVEDLIEREGLVNLGAARSLGEIAQDCREINRIIRKRWVTVFYKRDEEELLLCKAKVLIHI